VAWSCYELLSVSLMLKQHFVTARSVTLDLTRSPSDDPKLCGQYKTVMAVGPGVDSDR
jgi:hypothetical protein